MAFVYDIGGKVYEQRKLVFGQIRQLEKVLSSLPAGAMLTPAGVIKLLIEHNLIPRAAAVVLIPEGATARDKDLDALTAELEFALDIETGLQVVQDFFDCNPVSLIRDAAEKTAGRIGTVFPRPAASTGSTASSAPSPGETSPGETPSSGASDPTTQSPTPST